MTRSMLAPNMIERLLLQQIRVEWVLAERSLFERLLFEMLLLVWNWSFSIRCIAFISSFKSSAPVSDIMKTFRPSNSIILRCDKWFCRSWSIRAWSAILMRSLRDISVSSRSLNHLIITVIWGYWSASIVLTLSADMAIQRMLFYLCLCRAMNSFVGFSMNVIIFRSRLGGTSADFHTCNPDFSLIKNWKFLKSLRLDLIGSPSRVRPRCYGLTQLWR